MWVLVTTLLSFMSGWWSLARAYPAAGPLPGERFRWRSGRIGLVGYSNCLNLVASPEGLRVSLAFVFRIASPPFFVPWADVQVVRERRFFFRVVQLRFRKVPIATLEIAPALAESIARASGGALALPPEMD